MDPHENALNKGTVHTLIHFTHTIIHKTLCQVILNFYRTELTGFLTFNALCQKIIVTLFEKNAAMGTDIEKLKWKRGNQ